MPKIPIAHCTFCLKLAAETDLIDTRTNSIVIEGEYLEFSTIFKELLHYLPNSEYTCEGCKDQFVQFFIFKQQLKLPLNQNKFILTQIDDFLGQKDVCLSKIKVIRTINSITLQQDSDGDGNEIKEPLSLAEIPKAEKDPCVNDETSNVYEIMMSDAISCTKKGCLQVEGSEIDMQIHEFIKHTSFGIQLETEIEGCKIFINEDNVTNSLLLCSLCNAQVENNDILLLHFLDDHCNEIIKHINATLAKQFVDTTMITKYLHYMRNCLNGNNQEPSRESEDRNYFNQIYGNISNDDSDSDDIFEETVLEYMEVDTKDNIIIPASSSMRIERRDKTNDLKDEDKEWLRLEINKGKFATNLENGSRGIVYRCMVMKSCNYVSNSSPGLRYHLLMKHLKDRNNLFVDGEKEDKFENYATSMQIFKNNPSKNCCNECSLKFKDHRSFELHEKCHELFAIIAQHTLFPMCNTCNVKFLDEKTLNLHLQKHDRGENLREAILVCNGAVREQGKPVKTPFKATFPGETDENDFCWKCGHCEEFKSFTNEDYCNFHMIMAHLTCFTCPIDRMEFKGFKSVSLYIHHLRNKHPELFPNVSFKCTYCQIELSSIYEKLQHMKNCDSKIFQCDHCDKRYFKKGDLALHLKLVTGVIIFECSICFKKCLTQSDLKIHLRSHSKVKPYQCTLCKKSFRTLAARANHVESHNKQCYSCEFCEKTFKQRQTYRRHVKTVHETIGKTH